MPLGGGIAEQPTTGLLTSTYPELYFPLKASANGRLLLGADGRPFAIQGEQGWLMIASFSTADFTSLCQALYAKGVNTMTVMAINHNYEDRTGKTPGTGPQSNNGTWPFLLDTTGAAYAGTGITSPPNEGSTVTVTTADMSTTNDNYFKNILVPYLQIMATYGILAVFFPAYMGFQGHIAGWAADKQASGAAKCYTYGKYIGSLLAKQPNLIWMLGGDYDPQTWPAALVTCEEQMAQGIRDGGATQLMGGHFPENTLGGTATGLASDISHTSSKLAAMMGVNTIYAYQDTSQSMYQVCQAGWAFTPAIPTWLMDPGDRYENDGVSTLLQVRQNAWWGRMSSIVGQHFGNKPIWYSGSTTYASVSGATGLASTGHVQQQYLLKFWQAINWSTLIPSGTAGFRTIVTAGGGTNGGTDFVTCAGSTTGQLVVAYVPSAHTGSVTLDTSWITGHGNIMGQWYDPTNGTYQATAGSPYTNPSSLTLSVPGANSAGDSDWVLLLQTVS